jgi:hypothetical protein
MAKKELFETVQIIMEQYCEGCFLHQHVKKESGKRAAHRFCISECTVGEKLRELGKRLS